MHFRLLTSTQSLVCRVTMHLTNESVDLKFDDRYLTGGCPVAIFISCLHQIAGSFVLNSIAEIFESQFNE